MKTNNMLLALVLSAGVISTQYSIAQNNAGLFIYRDAHGHLTPESKVAAKQMTRMAAHNGYVTLWLTLDYEINLYLDKETEQEAIAAQNAAIRAGLDEVLSPMVARGAVWHPEAGPLIQGPGCTVRATVAGLRRLIRDERIIQIVGVD